MKTSGFLVLIVVVGLLAACVPGLDAELELQPTENKIKTIAPSSTTTPTANYIETAEAVGTQIPLELTAIAATPSPTHELRPTLAASYTPSAVPTSVPPLVAHEWLPAPVVFSHVLSCGEGSMDCYPKILYSDGLFLTPSQVKIGDEYFRFLLTTRVESTEVCKVLNTVDQIGFFDYDPDTFGFRPMDLWFIKNYEITGWETNEFSLASFTNFFSGWSFYQTVDGDEFCSANCPDGICGTCPPIILPALQNADRLLNLYEPPNLSIYQPDRVSVTVRTRGELDPGAPVWPIDEIALKDLAADKTCGETDSRSFVFSDDLAEEIAKLTNNSPSFSSGFTQAGVTYYVNTRIVLPYESPDACKYYFAGIPEFPQESATKLSCSPADGVLEQFLP